MDKVEGQVAVGPGGAFDESFRDEVGEVEEESAGSSAESDGQGEGDGTPDWLLNAESVLHGDYLTDATEQVYMEGEVDERYESERCAAEGYAGEVYAEDVYADEEDDEQKLLHSSESKSWFSLLPLACVIPWAAGMSGKHHSNESRPSTRNVSFSIISMHDHADSHTTML